LFGLELSLSEQQGKAKELRIMRDGYVEALCRGLGRQRPGAFDIIDRLGTAFARLQRGGPRLPFDLNLHEGGSRVMQFRFNEKAGQFGRGLVRAFGGLQMDKLVGTVECAMASFDANGAGKMYYLARFASEVDAGLVLSCALAIHRLME